MSHPSNPSSPSPQDPSSFTSTPLLLSLDLSLTLLSEAPTLLLPRLEVLSLQVMRFLGAVHPSMYFNSSHLCR